MRLLTASLGAVCLLAVGSARADWESRIVHSGATNPALEGFNVNSGPGTFTNAVVGDLGFDAWEITSTNGAGGCTYTQSAFGDADGKALYNGWRYRARVRAASTNDNPDSGSLMDTVMPTQDGKVRNFGLYFGSGPTTNLLLAVSTLSGIWTSTPGYHLVEMIFNVTSQTATISIDGVAQVSNYEGGVVGGGSFVRFGAFGGQAGRTRWNLVGFDVDDRPFMVKAQAIGGYPRLYWVGASNHLFTVQTANQDQPDAWTDEPTYRSNVWNDTMNYTDFPALTNRLFRVLQFQP